MVCMTYNTKRLKTSCIIIYFLSLFRKILKRDPIGFAPQALWQELIFLLMQWKTLFSIDPDKPLWITCLIYRPRKKITTSVFGA